MLKCAEHDWISQYKALNPNNSVTLHDLNLLLLELHSFHFLAQTWFSLAPQGQPQNKRKNNSSYFSHREKSLDARINSASSTSAKIKIFSFLVLALDLFKHFLVITASTRNVFELFFIIVRLLRHTSDNNCALCDKSVKLATFEGIQMLNNSGYGGIAESTCIRNTRVLKKMLSQHFCSNKLF